VLTPAQCAIAGGTYHGDGTDCGDYNGNGQPDICEPNLPTCAGDVDGDGDTDLDDLVILLADFGCTGGGCAGDVDGDGDTDLDDLVTLLADFGCQGGGGEPNCPPDDCRNVSLSGPNCVAEDVTSVYLVNFDFSTNGPGRVAQVELVDANTGIVLDRVSVNLPSCTSGTRSVLFYLQNDQGMIRGPLGAAPSPANLRARVTFNQVVCQSPLLPAWAPVTNCTVTLAAGGPVECCVPGRWVTVTGTITNGASVARTFTVRLIENGNPSCVLASWLVNVPACATINFSYIVTPTCDTGCRVVFPFGALLSPANFVAQVLLGSSVLCESADRSLECDTRLECTNVWMDGPHCLPPECPGPPNNYTVNFDVTNWFLRWDGEPNSIVWLLDADPVFDDVLAREPNQFDCAPTSTTITVNFPNAMHPDNFIWCDDPNDPTCAPRGLLGTSGEGTAEVWPYIRMHGQTQPNLPGPCYQSILIEATPQCGGTCYGVTCPRQGGPPNCALVKCLGLDLQGPTTIPAGGQATYVATFTYDNVSGQDATLNIGLYDDDGGIDGAGESLIPHDDLLAVQRVTLPPGPGQIVVPFVLFCSPNGTVAGPHGDSSEGDTGPAELFVSVDGVTFRDNDPNFPICCPDSNALFVSCGP